MRRVSTILVGPAGPAVVTIALLAVLTALSPPDSAVIIGSGVAQAMDPLILLIGAAAAFLSRRWWQICLAGAAVSGVIAARPDVFEMGLPWRIMTMVAGFALVTIVSGLIAAVIVAARGRRTVTGIP